MQRRAVRVPVRSDYFPFFSSYTRQSKFIPTGSDESPQSERYAIPIPAPIYAQNVMPTMSGYQSVAPDACDEWNGNFYLYESGTPFGDETGFSEKLLKAWHYGKMIPINDNANRLGYVAVLNSGWLYGVVGDANPNLPPPLDIAPQFSGYIPFPGVQSGTPYPGTDFQDWDIDIQARNTTYAFLRDTTYIYNPYLGLFSLALDTGEIIQYTSEQTGLDYSRIKGICSAAGYLIAYTENEISRSSLFSPTDFVPTTLNGAGVETPEFVKGPIVACVSIENGFIIYSTQNIVSAAFTAQIDTPFAYRELGDGSGIEGVWNVTTELGLAEHFVWTSTGLQVVTLQDVQSPFPDASEFLQYGLIETVRNNVGIEADLMASNALDGTAVPETEYFPQTPIMQDRPPFDVSLVLCGKRYLVVQYSYAGIQNSKHSAIVFDKAIKAWGKLKTFDTAFYFDYKPVSDFTDIRYVDFQDMTYEDLDDIRYVDLSEVVSYAAKAARVIGAVIGYYPGQVENGQINYSITPGGYAPSVIRSVVFDTRWDNRVTAGGDPWANTGAYIVYGYYTPVRGRWAHFHELRLTMVEGNNQNAIQLGQETQYQDPDNPTVDINQPRTPYLDYSVSSNQTGRFLIDYVSPALQFALGKFQFNASAIEFFYTLGGDSE